jgi:uncharacterized protein (TIGR02597 family)
MKLHHRLLPLLGAALLAPLPAFAQTVTTKPVGAMTYSFPATTATIQNTYISLPLTNPAVYASSVVSLTGTTVTFNGTPFFASQLVQPATPYFARIVTGVQAGRVLLVTANTVNSVTLDVTDDTQQITYLDTIGFALAVGDRIELILGDTISSIFGDGSLGNPLLLKDGTSAINADSISLYDKTTGQFEIFYFSTSDSFKCWRPVKSTTNVNNMVIRPEEAILVTRKKNRPATSLIVTGDVPSVPMLLKVLGQKQSIAIGTTYPSAIALSALKLNGWQKSNSGLQADALTIKSTTTGSDNIYYQLTNDTWRKVGDSITDQSSFVIPAGIGFTITKKAPVSGAASFISIVKPYTL